MRYISGIHALNIPCQLNTTGDWHASAIQWQNPHWRDTKNAFFGDWGIEQGHEIPEHQGTFAVANHLRACLDMLEEGDYSNLCGMYHDYLGNDIYLSIFFQKVWSMHNLANWPEIDCFMEKEFLMKWLRFRQNVSRGDSNAEISKMATKTS